MMRVILQEDVPSLGVVGDLVRVRDGYARNFLIPQKKAVFASARSVHELEHQKRLAAHKRELALVEAKQAKGVLEGLSICMHAKVAPAPIGEDGKPRDEKLQKLHGTITNRDLSRVLGDAKVKIDHRRITLSDTIRTVGKYSAKVRLDGGVDVQLAFWVIPEGAKDVDSEKKRVEAAQIAVQKAQEELKTQEEAARKKLAAEVEAAAAAAASAKASEQDALNVPVAAETPAKKKSKKSAAAE